MATVYLGKHQLPRRRRGSSGGLFWLGVAMLMLGAAAVVVPIISTLVDTVFVGWVFLFVAAGTYLLFARLDGAVALARMAAVILGFQGISESFLAVEFRPFPGWVGMAISGLSSIILAIVVLGGWVATSVAAIGIVIGINFLTTGFGYINISGAFWPLTQNATPKIRWK